MAKNKPIAEITEQTYWDGIRAIYIREGRRLHPALNYSSWEAFCKAGKPWHNHGDASFPNFTIGDRWREREAFEERMRRRPSIEQMHREACERLGIKPYKAPQMEVLGENEPKELIPAAARLKMIADAQGGYGALGFTISSPDSQIRAHLEGIARNGFKPPPSITTC